MTLAFGTITLNKGYKTIATGIYRISGNQLVKTFSYGTVNGQFVQEEHIRTIFLIQKNCTYETNGGLMLNLIKNIIVSWEIY